jgi:hypothetical protein
MSMKMNGKIKLFTRRTEVALSNGKPVNETMTESDLAELSIGLIRS